MKHRGGTKTEDSELRRFIVQEIALMVADGMKTGAFMDWSVANKIADKVETNTASQVTAERERLLNSIEDELLKFTAKHDKPMRDEALSIIASHRSTQEENMNETTDTVHIKQGDMNETEKTEEIDETEVLFVMALFGEANVKLMKVLEDKRGNDTCILKEAIRRFENGKH